MELLVSPDNLGIFNVGPTGSFARVFNGEQHEIPSVSLMLAELQPGEGPAWHRHAYDEVFVIEEGQASFRIGDEMVNAEFGQVVIARSGVPHSFMNPGETLLRITAIHVSSKVAIEWLDPPLD